MGSEMCIRDSAILVALDKGLPATLLALAGDILVMLAILSEVATVAIIKRWYQ